MVDILAVFLLLVSIKSLIVGSDFNFYLWYKYKEKYTKWYFNRPFYKD
jgi:hypothetical protein